MRDGTRYPGWEYFAALGRVPNVTAFRKFGVNASVSGTEDVWGQGGVMVWPDSAGTVSVVSSSAEDGAGTATGALEVTIQGLDENYVDTQETVTMNGLTPVVTTQTFIRANRMFVGECGSNDSNVGNITASIGGNVQESIRANEGQSAVALYTVPAGKTFIVDYYSVGVGRLSNGSADANVRGQIRLYDETVADASNHQGWRTISNIYLYNGQEHANDKSVTILPEKTDLRVQVTLSAGTTQADAIVGGHLINNETLSKY